jgi:hypothetical protein
VSGGKIQLILQDRNRQENIIDIQDGEPECYLLKVEDGVLKILASDELGMIYGIYEVSRSLLGVQNFWFWNDQHFIKKEAYLVPDDYELQSKPFAVKYRGWFINDEVLLMQWNIDGDADEPWRMVFEALLRCGGNMTIPGTDHNCRKYASLASSMGLIITHHHAEPLGAEMFIRAYPNLVPSYAEHADKFQNLWKDSIMRQRGMKVLWNLGFRGQGDRPFWEEDPKYQTSKDRGALISKLIRIQYNMVNEVHPNAVCCTNLYGEIMGLYQEGFLDLPEDIIRVWADNGYGKMVSRRQGNCNPRVYALPKDNDKGKNGIYYHAAFYDLQAGNELTMMPNPPAFIRKELQKVLSCNSKEYWIINCANVKPHVYMLDMIADMWHTGDIKDIIHEKDLAHLKQYVHKYYESPQEEQIATCMKDYWNCSIQYGENPDEHAGEQFCNHVPRIIASQFMRDKERAAEDLLWAVQADSLQEQIIWYQRLCKKAVTRYEKYLRECIETEQHLENHVRILFEDTILLQAKLYDYCYKGALYLCNGLLKAYEGDYKNAFYQVGHAREQYRSGNAVLREREHDQWLNFYQNDCQTDLKQSAWVLSGLMSFLRNLGEGPHFYMWQREIQESKEDQKVALLLNTKNHVDDNELFELMKMM